jgi:hypothetical protein
MHRARTFFYVCAGLLCLALAFVTCAFASQPEVYFLRGGEIWRTRDGGATVRPQTDTKGMIQSFEISRHGRYVAYEVVVDSTAEVGAFEPGEMIPRVPVAHIIVADRRTLRAVKTISPDFLRTILDSDDPFVCIERWLAPEMLTFYTANSIETGNWFGYDAVRDTTVELNGTEAFHLAEYSDEALDGSLRVTRELDVGRDHVVLQDLKSGASQELFRANANALALSPDGRTVAGIDDVDWPSGYRRLWVTGVERPLLRQVAAVPFETWSDRNTPLAWSADGRHLLTPWGQVVTVADSSKHVSLAGTGFVWYDSHTVLVTQATRVIAVNVDSNASRTFLDNVTNVRVAAH